MTESHDNPSSTITDPWELMGPLIKELYLDRNLKLKEVITRMKLLHNFYALYYHIGKWKLQKNVSKKKKDQMAKQLVCRAQAGKAGNNVTYNGRPVKPGKLRRHMKTAAREQSQLVSFQKPPANTTATKISVPLFANSIFLKWNMPYAAMQQLFAEQLSSTSPLTFAASTPGSDMSFATPSSVTSPQPQGAPSPNTSVVRMKKALDHARLFIQGRHDELLMALDINETRLISDWLYQYWLFCFKITKHWGRGPRSWTADLLGLNDFTHPLRILSQMPSLLDSAVRDTIFGDCEPRSLCRWFIHVQPDWGNYVEYSEEEQLGSMYEDPADESTWLPLSPAADLPVAIAQVAKAAERSPYHTRNLSQVEAALIELQQKKVDITSLHPLHLATSYLDGYRSCCNILTVLLRHVDRPQVRTAYTNELGHTVLDNLLISILKSYSSAKPSVISSSLKDTVRFVGEEVDICGRWDVDTPCVRRQYATGRPAMPFSWKHKFCHGSIQTICHCFSKMPQSLYARLFREQASGLYSHQCFDCGVKLELQPLHSLVMTAYHLADKGCEGEDLFGMLACLLCLISGGLDPRTMANVSVSILLELDVSDTACNHELLTAAGLAESISNHSIVGTWPMEARTGWEVFCGVLRRCEEADSEVAEHLDISDLSHHFIGPPGVSDVKYIHHGLHDSATPFGSQNDLATLWASAQAELLTYRRLRHGDDWISSNFSMEQLSTQLQNSSHLSVRFADWDLLRQHCVCGRFGGHPLTTLPDAVDPDLANLDVWNRATYGVLLEDE
ncbi:hypothetical protein T440DRAFT_497069 [Plenodomus tracheiphilus IPT5]|uniref:Clr5 domain-containing protein n=1 Tax=Plenodomus tracheiphilus IPT5 TaxID=1408161 RepID=A0A6A7BCC0_9PLEO|nr:hypothetical protein T440DRAFT_497069 [Plenodomus tracheiphilus IPT5]